ncbi:peroxiredoxin-like family protein [Mycobacterium sp. CVI_P3]|uniref:thioredoxin-dependent peroxiredoxin n=1 Tax=Mycobacterium pinniadriaticum TaxID=2994102 RepID=A0ABT3SHE7_9MYCO|nr:peroxiredoxin-like family protein [Mycobacterium pinniadriaticum]MCX2932435.1 peroxiredoxin-like family protein [Mycobacterium pinniadriaticum]MCX2938931.1 peroxiredoxin-like family protein [Mycobacterium pinniadriaticum]
MSTTEPVTIAAQVAQLQEGLSEHLPADVIEVLVADQKRMLDDGAAPGAARPGTVLPDPEVIDAQGNTTTITALRGGGPAVVVFYRGAWCPYCNLALKTYQDQLVPTLAARGIRLIAISPQKPDGTLSSIEVNALTFDVVSDPGNRIAAALGIVTAPSEASRAATQRLGLDLREANADGGYELPMPTVLVIDGDGVITWSDIHPDYTTRTEVAEILAAVADLG